MASKGLRTEEIPKHRILREAYRHYTEFKAYVAATGKSVIEHGYWVYDDDGNKVKKVIIEISFWDLHDALESLAPRKKEAVLHNVIYDKRQRDVAEIMGITTVSVGQYVESGMLQLAKRYFAEENEDKDETAN